MLEVLNREWDSSSIILDGDMHKYDIGQQHHCTKSKIDLQMQSQ